MWNRKQIASQYHVGSALLHDKHLLYCQIIHKPWELATMLISLFLNVSFSSNILHQNLLHINKEGNILFEYNSSCALITEKCPHTACAVLCCLLRWSFPFITFPRLVRNNHNCLGSKVELPSSATV